MNSTTFNMVADSNSSPQSGLMMACSGTAAIAKAFAGALLVSTPTFAADLYTVPKVDTRGIYKSSIRERQLLGGLPQPTAPLAAQFDTAERQTTPVEELIGEMRSWNLLAGNWDGEGSSAPRSQSLCDAEDFLRLVELFPMAFPEPMLLASGNSALYWHEGDFYADLEFLSEHRIAYFIRHSGDKHKGVLEFKKEEMPPVLKALLVA